MHRPRRYAESPQTMRRIRQTILPTYQLCWQPTLLLYNLSQQRTRALLTHRHRTQNIKPTLTDWSENRDARPFLLGRNTVTDFFCSRCRIAYDSEKYSHCKQEDLHILESLYDKNLAEV